MAKGFLANLKGVDAFGKTTDDVKVQTRTGAFFTLLSAAIILSFTVMEFMDYRRIYTDTSLIVDRSRREKQTVRFNVTFPRVRCDLLSLDIMVISGETQRDYSHNVLKTRLEPSGKVIPGSGNADLRNDPQLAAAVILVRRSGRRISTRDGAFPNPDAIEQCKNEGWSDKLKEQANEDCNIAGRIRVHKVIGNIHLSPGKSFQSSTRNIYELLSFEGDDEYDFRKAKLGREMKARLGLSKHPLDETEHRTSKAQYMFQYFLKVVSTQFRTLDCKTINSHQYSVTNFERDLAEDGLGDTPQGVHLQHGVSGVPGAFFNYEISPILVVHTDTRQSFAHFVTSTCAIVGGVLTVASLIDSVLFATSRALKKQASGVKVM
ncbi:endoplasmic reticulum-derived transport vesicle ERV46 [Lentinula raphanica]|nr:endoplasmic reticulum-derived transport vesicle ERV46 [Lentinula raphanica]